MAITAPLRPSNPPKHEPLEVYLGEWMDNTGPTFKLKASFDPALSEWFAPQPIRPYNTGSDPFALALGTPYLTVWAE